MRSEMPPDSISAPARMNSGMASRTNESTPPRILIGRMIRLDAADAEQVGERGQRQRERERHAERGGDEEAADQHGERRGAEQRAARSTEASARPAAPSDQRQRARSRQTASPSRTSLLHEHARPSAASDDRQHDRRSSRPRGRWPASRSPALAIVSRQAGTTSHSEEREQHEPQPAIDRPAGAAALNEPDERGDARMLTVPERGDAAGAHQPDRAAGARSPRSRDTAAGARGGRRPAGRRPRPARPRGPRSSTRARDRTPTAAGGARAPARSRADRLEPGTDAERARFGCPTAAPPAGGRSALSMSRMVMPSAGRAARAAPRPRAGPIAR